jgi:hypothetical protein
MTQGKLHAACEDFLATCPNADQRTAFYLGAIMCLHLLLRAGSNEARDAIEQELLEYARSLKRKPS